MNIVLFTKGEKVLVSSRTIAKDFKKEHKRVLQDIRELGCSEGFRQHNFVPSSYETEQNKSQPEYLITRDGFAILVMGYTGIKAMQFKEAYIKQFNQMESFIREKLSSEWQETRIKGKLQRRNETDIILTKLIPLAELQGSKNSGKLYMTYSKLVNGCVGIPAKSREKANQRILDVVYNLENLIENVISEEVAKGTYYKDIYQICKGKCRLMVELSYLPQQKLIA